MANYLLAWRPENDKSQFLTIAGYTDQDADRLADDIRKPALAEGCRIRMLDGLRRYLQDHRRPEGTKWESVESDKHLDDRSRDKYHEVITLYPAKEN